MKYWISKINFFKREPEVFKVFFFSTIAVFTVTALLIQNYIQYNTNITESTKEETYRQTVESAMRFDEDFKEIIEITSTIASKLSSGELRKEDIIPQLEQHLGGKLKIFGIGVAYIPYVNDPTIRKTSPYYVCKGNKDEIQNDELVKIYSAPIYYTDSVTGTKIKTGEVFADFLLTDIKDVLASLNLGKSGYGYILSRNGTFIAHPVSEYNLKQKTIFEIANERDDKQYLKLGQETILGKSGVLEYKDELTGQSSWIFYEPIPSIGWSLVITFIKDDILIDNEYLRHQLILISISVLMLLILLTAIITRVYLKTYARLIVFTVLTSVALLSEVFYIWNLALNYNVQEDASTVKIVDRTGADHFRNGYDTKVSRVCPDATPHYIPTGIFIETIEFPSASTVFLSGYVWQKYEFGVHDSIKRGVIFPESVQDEFTESFHTRGEQYESFGWYFRITIRKDFHYTKYPFDQINLSVRILPRDFENYVILSPELDAYKYTNPSLLPGLSKEMAVPGWDLNYSNFVYKMNNYNSTFGISNFGCREETPELYFDISLSRRFEGTVISGTLPILVMLAILFILQTISTPTMDTVTRVLGPTGSFFFAALLAHVRIRSDLEVKDIIYFEYFYILLYTMILYVFLNSVLYSRDTKSTFYTYKNSIIPKLIYWPMFLTLLLVITIYVLLLN